MTDKISAPRHALRGLQHWLARYAHALDFLFADGQMKSGTLVAINAENAGGWKIMPEVKSLIEAG